MQISFLAFRSLKSLKVAKSKIVDFFVNWPSVFSMVVIRTEPS